MPLNPFLSALPLAALRASEVWGPNGLTKKVEPQSCTVPVLGYI